MESSKCQAFAVGSGQVVVPHSVQLADRRVYRKDSVEHKLHTQGLQDDRMDIDCSDSRDIAVAGLVCCPEGA